jgi:hypothetical protein
MNDRFAGGSVRRMARVAGVLYLLTMLTGIFAQRYVSGALIVEGNAATTAANILAHRSWFESGFAVYLVEMACQIALTAIFYELLKPAGRTVSLVSAYLGLAGCIIKTTGRLFYIAPLLVLSGAHCLSVFSPDQLQALALLFLRVNDHGAGIGLALFGFAALLKGYLIIRSTFLPRVLGVLSVAAGLCLLTFLSPTLGPRLFVYTAAVGLLGAVPQILWLLVVGVNDQRWREQAGAGA